MGGGCCMWWHELAYSGLRPVTRQQNKDDASCESLTGRHSGGGRGIANVQCSHRGYHIETHERPDGKAKPVEYTRCGGRRGFGRREHE